MRTNQKIFTVAAAFVVALAIGGSAVADCGANPGLIATTGVGGKSLVWTEKFQEDATFYYNPYSGYTYCGPYASPGDCATPVSPAFNMSFWALGTGDLALGSGNDNGSFNAVGAGAVYFYQYAAYGYYTYWGAELNTGWQPGTDGCIGGNNCLCMLLTDTDGSDTFYAIVSARSSSTFTTTLEQGGTDGTGNNNSAIVMRRIDAPSINGSVRVGTDVDLSVSVGPQQGVYVKPDGANCQCGPTGYKVLQAIVPRGNMPPTDRSTGWTEAPLAVGGSQPAGGTPIGSQVTVRSVCGAADSDVYLTTELFFDSNFSTSLVSTNSSRVECGTNLADPDDRPRQRPDAIKPKPNTNRPTRGGRGR